MPDLSHIVKAYDVRGVVPDQWDERLAELFGAAFVQVSGAKALVIGHDMRPSSPGLSRAFGRGAVGRGADVTEIGLCSTDELYYASGALDMAGAMFTASHNPARYNGIKMCRAGARPVGQDSGLAEIRALVEEWAERPDAAPAPVAGPGTVQRRDVLPGYAAHLRSLVDLSAIRPLKVVVDAGNGMGGHTIPTVFEGLPLQVTEMYFALDGTFPNHEANPLNPENIVDLQARVRSTDADLGLAFDGDADRCFVVDERGEPVSPSAITALVAARELAKAPGSAIIHNLITSRSVPEVVRENGGTPVRTRVGHSFIKAEMARTGAIFGGEHSAHYYFRDFWNADTGMLAALHVMAALGEQDRPLSELVAAYDRYPSSGEINSEVDDQAARTAAVKAAFADRPGTTVDELDGLTVQGPGWWFNLRPSNTEPLLRLNIEADDAATVDKLRDEVLGIVRG
ncbi:phosphomannomutase/phosphoglucomutase [Streptomyces hoynatensis]|uniref:Phosphomannomutase/phosphoglucomutase n=1 Tax=Streptomyces hoynatensis TaxID=1141874 RepID=A0A3A9YMV9_9ACTN|nr:phosphomannomutase/phosphoglucomutase [Streptomyces hoynatensis]RKN37419.1 phosphomannomutase/phosphoglucomutase [Streptomyces hoynatensis]